MSNRLSWQDCLDKGDDYYSFQDPLSDWFMTCGDFHAMYGEYMIKFTGRKKSLSIAAVFEPNGLIEGHWMFINEKAKRDLVEGCISLGVLSPLEEIRTGDYDKAFNELEEWDGGDFEEVSEEEFEIPQEEVKPKKGKEKKPQMNSEDKEKMIRESRLANLEKLKDQLAKEEDEGKKEKLLTKIDKIEEQLNN